MAASWITILLTVNLLLLGYLAWRHWNLMRYEKVLRQEMELLRLAPQDGPVDLNALLGTGQRGVLVLDILNPMEVAAQQSWFVDKFGPLAAPIIRRIVLDQACQQIKDEVLKYGLRAQVTVHRAA